MIALAGTGNFPAGGFDSLSAVELSSTLSSTLGVQLPGTLVFDYPSVQAMASFIHGIMGTHGHAPDLAASYASMRAQQLPISAGFGPIDAPHALHSSRIASVTMASRLPMDHTVCGRDADGICSVPFERWDLEALRVRSSATHVISHILSHVR